MATETNTKKTAKNLHNLTETFSNFVGKCVGLTSSYVEKHYELLRVYYAFKQLDKRFKTVEEKITIHLGQLTDAIDNADKSVLNKDIIKKLQDEQREVAYQADIYDDVMLDIASKFSSELGEEISGTDELDYLSKFITKINEGNLYPNNNNAYNYGLDTSSNPEFQDLVGKINEIFTTTPPDNNFNKQYLQFLRKNLAAAERIVEKILYKELFKFQTLYGFNVVKNIMGLISHVYRPLLKINKKDLQSDNLEMYKFKVEVSDMDQQKNIVDYYQNTQTPDPESMLKKFMSESFGYEHRFCFYYKLQLNNKINKDNLKTIIDNEMRDYYNSNTENKDTHIFKMLKRVNSIVNKEGKVKHLNVNPNSTVQDLLVFEIPLKYMYVYDEKNFMEKTGNDKDEVYLFPVESRLNYQINNIYNKLKKTLNEKLPGNNTIDLNCGIYSFSGNEGYLFRLQNPTFCDVNSDLFGNLAVLNENILNTTRNLLSEYKLKDDATTNYNSDYYRIKSIIHYKNLVTYDLDYTSVTQRNNDLKDAETTPNIHELKQFTVYYMHYILHIRRYVLLQNKDKNVFYFDMNTGKTNLKNVDIPALMGTIGQSIFKKADLQVLLATNVHKPMENNGTPVQNVINSFEQIFNGINAKKTSITQQAFEIIS